MRKIIFLYPNFFFIGAQRGAAATIRQIDRSQFSIVVAVIDPSGDMSSEIPSDVPIVTFSDDSLFCKIPFFKIFYWPFLLKKILKEENPEFIVSICPQTNFTCVLYRLFFKKDNFIFIGEEHQHLSNALKNDPNDFKIPWRILYFFSLSRYNTLDAIRCVSLSASNDFISNWGVSPSRAKLLYPAFDLERINLRAHNKKKNNVIPVICSVGRLTSQKNFELLIRSFSIVRRATPAKLVVAGTGPEMSSLQQLINDLGLVKDVRLLGFVEYAEEVIASSDIFVMTSIWEGFPATLIEAMVLKTPVVSVNCESGPAEIIQSGVNGVIVADWSPESISGAILELIKNPHMRYELAENASESISKFSLERSVLKFQKLLLSLEKKESIL